MLAGERNYAEQEPSFDIEKLIEKYPNAVLLAFINTLKRISNEPRMLTVREEKKKLQDHLISIGKEIEQIPGEENDIFWENPSMSSLYFDNLKTFLTNKEDFFLNNLLLDRYIGLRNVFSNKDIWDKIGIPYEKLSDIENTYKKLLDQARAAIENAKNDGTTVEKYIREIEEISFKKDKIKRNQVNDRDLFYADVIPRLKKILEELTNTENN